MDLPIKYVIAILINKIIEVTIIIVFCSLGIADKTSLLLAVVINIQSVPSIGANPAYKSLPSRE